MVCVILYFRLSRHYYSAFFLNSNFFSLGNGWTLLRLKTNKGFLFYAEESVIAILEALAIECKLMGFGMLLN